MSINITSMHCSRMHTARLLPLSPSMHCPPRGWGVSATQGECLLPGEVSATGVGCLLLGWCLLPRGCLLPGGCLLWGCIPACNGADTPPPLRTDRHLWKHNLRKGGFPGVVNSSLWKKNDHQLCFVHTWYLHLRQHHHRHQSLTLHEWWYKQKRIEWVWTHSLHQRLCCYWHNVKLWRWCNRRRQVWTDL